MFRLSLVLFLMTGITLSGTFVTIVLVAEMWSFPWVFGAGVLGLILGWPVALMIARWIKAEDPEWDEKRDRPAPNTR